MTGLIKNGRTDFLINSDTPFCTATETRSNFSTALPISCPQVSSTFLITFLKNPTNSTGCVSEQ